MIDETISDERWGNLVEWNNQMTAACDALLRDCGPFSATWKQCETMVGDRRCCGWIKIDEKGETLYADVAVFGSKADVAAWLAVAVYLI
jgi:hypothetical protein